MKKGNHLLTLGLVVCSIVSTHFVSTHFISPPVVSAQQAAPQEIADNEFQVGGVLYMQTAGEYRALAYQAFNAAKMSVDADDKSRKKLPEIERKKDRAVVVDIDETVLDNSPYQAFMIKNRTTYNPTTWQSWGEMRAAKAIPGAVDFLNYANKKGIRVFYVSNRDEKLRAATMDNLKKVGFPDVTDETLMLKTKDSTKEPRRQIIAQKYRIVLLVGDNLADFAQAFDNRSITDRFAEVDKARELWGTRYIALPNVMYGDWESVFYDYNKQLPESEKTARRNSALMAY